MQLRAHQVVKDQLYKQARPTCYLSRSMRSSTLSQSPLRLCMPIVAASPYLELHCVIGVENLTGDTLCCQPSRHFFPKFLVRHFGFPSPWCGEEGTRTPDLLLAKQALYQLSYSPRTSASWSRLLCVRVLGFEPRTSALSELRSSQLSYTRNANSLFDSCADAGCRPAPFSTVIY
jgi:hypothetical protein